MRSGASRAVVSVGVGVLVELPINAGLGCRVITYVVPRLSGGVCALLIAPTLLGPLLHAEPAKLGTVVSRIERRYNSLATLRIRFQQTMRFVARPPLTEEGTLYLLRPSKMRWDYTRPEGKLLVGDGEMLHMYNPRANQVRQVKPSETGDLRAPLSFLLGRLRLRRQFDNLRLSDAGDQAVLIADGRSGKEAYTHVEFRYDPEDYRLLGLKVFGQDESVTVFRFEDEQVNTALDPALFVFQPPEGADFIDGPRGKGDR